MVYDIGVVYRRRVVRVRGVVDVRVGCVCGYCWICGDVFDCVIFVWVLNSGVCVLFDGVEGYDCVRGEWKIDV